MYEEPWAELPQSWESQETLVLIILASHSSAPSVSLLPLPLATVALQHPSHLGFQEQGRVQHHSCSGPLRLSVAVRALPSVPSYTVTLCRGNVLNSSLGLLLTNTAKEGGFSPHSYNIKPWRNQGWLKTDFVKRNIKCEEKYKSRNPLTGTVCCAL